MWETFMSALAIQSGIQVFEDLPGFPPAPLCPFKAMVKVDNTVFVSGSISFKPGIPPDHLPFAEQIANIFNNIEKCFERIDPSLKLCHITNLYVIHRLTVSSDSIATEIASRIDPVFPLSIQYVLSTQFPHPVDIQVAVKAQIPTGDLDLLQPKRSLVSKRMKSDKTELVDVVRDLFITQIGRANLWRMVNVCLFISAKYDYHQINSAIESVFNEVGFTRDKRNFARSIVYCTPAYTPLSLDTEMVGD
jgi:enamine deaminase RidA (YjgF/YER057c/UK114 family)